MCPRPIAAMLEFLPVRWLSDHPDMHLTAMRCSVGVEEGLKKKTSLTNLRQVNPSDSSDGSPALAVFRHHYLKIVLPGFPYNCLSVSCSDIGFLKKSCI